MQEILLFGDSIAQGIVLGEDEKYRISRTGCIRLLRRRGLPIRNYGVHGFTILQGMDSFRQISDVSGTCCVIEFGGNDCDLDWDAVSQDPTAFHDGRVPLKEFEQALRLFVTEAREKGSRPVLVTPLALMSERYFRWVCRGRNREHILKYLRDDPESISRWQERYATVIRETAWEMDCALEDIRFWMLNQENYPELICQDGIHPNEEGHEKLAELVSANCGKLWVTR